MIGGILSIVSGVIGVLGVLLLIGMMFFSYAIFSVEGFNNESTEGIWFIAIVYGGMAIVGGLLSVLAIVGGAFALKRKLWGLALAGAIAGIIVFFPCGIAATVLTAMARQEFLPAAQPNVVT
jgi:hypothetical protein